MAQKTWRRVEQKAPTTNNPDRVVYGWVDLDDGLVVTTSVEVGKPPPLSLSGTVGVTHKLSGLSVVQHGATAAYVRQVLPLLRAMPIPWAEDEKVCTAAFTTLDEAASLAYKAIAEHKYEPPTTAPLQVPIGCFTPAELLKVWPTPKKSTKLVVAGEEVYLDHRSDEPWRFDRVRAYLRVAPAHATVRVDVDEQSGELRVSVAYGFGGANFFVRLGVGVEAAARAKTLMEESLAGFDHAIASPPPVARLAPRPRPAPSPSPAKVAKAPRVAKVASSDGFDTALAVASGIPNLAAWMQDGELLRSGEHVIRPSSSGFTWQHADGSSSSKSYANVGTAVFYLQASRFPEWKRGSFESYAASHGIAA